MLNIAMVEYTRTTVLELLSVLVLQKLKKSTDHRGLKRLECSLMQPEMVQTLLSGPHFTIVLTKVFARRKIFERRRTGQTFFFTRRDGDMHVIDYTYY